MFLIKELQLQNGKMINWHWDGTPIHLIGPNGCGKSLLLKNLADLFPAKYETFEYLNRTREKHNPEIYRSEILYLPAQTSMNECQTVEEFMDQPWKFEIYESHKPVYDFKSLLDEWKLTNQLTQKLSSGEKQILSILRALTLKAKVILIDETFAHIDSTKKKKLLELLLDWRLHHHGSYILVSHEVSGFSSLEVKPQNFSDLIAFPH